LNRSLTNTIVIIGAGPAGVIASLFLSKNKIPHLLIDKAIFPREKVCGESFAGNVFEVLDDIDPSIKEEMLTQNIIKQANELSFYSDSEKRFIFKMPFTKSSKIQASRYQFDEFLIRKASQKSYCTLMEGIAVKKATKKINGIELLLSDSSSIDTKMVVFSNGALGNLIKNFRGEEFEPSGTQFLFARGVFKGARVVNPNSAIDFTLLKKPFNNGSYLTYLPNGNFTLGLMLEAKKLKNSSESLETIFNKSIKNHPYLNKVLSEAQLISEIKSTALKLGDFKKKFAGDNYLIAGDAGAPLNPVTGMGVMMAMYYGRNTAKAIVEAVTKNDFSYDTLKKYDQHCKKKYKSEFRKSNLYTYLQVNHFNLFVWVLKMVHGNKFLEKRINKICF